MDPVHGGVALWEKSGRDLLWLEFSFFFDEISALMISLIEIIFYEILNDLDFKWCIEINFTEDDLNVNLNLLIKMV